MLSVVFFPSLTTGALALSKVIVAIQPVSKQLCIGSSFSYDISALIDVMDGYNGTVFAYGQTGSGKTFTMMVRYVEITLWIVNDMTVKGADIDSEDLKGIIPRITEQIFTSIVESDSHLEYLVKVSYMEIYLERIRDLLARERPSSRSVDVFKPFRTLAQNDNLQIHEEKSKGVYVKGLTDYYVSSTKEVYEIMRQGATARVVTATSEFSLPQKSLD